MKQYTIVAENADKGIAILTDENGQLTAYVNGKHYNTWDGRPVKGDGRQLREDSRNVISDLLETARINRDNMLERMQKELETAAAEMAKAASPKKSFAETLEESFLATLAEKSSGELFNMIFPEVREKVIAEFGVMPVKHEFKIPERKPWETTEILHKDFDRILNMIMDNESVYLCGPAGTGKSYLAQQIAKALDLEYYYTNSVTDDVQIKGFVDANGRYHETQFYNAFVNGGVFLLDELDASIPETLVLLNNALANGYFSFPNGKAQAHKDFHCIAAGNTFGTGADNTYTGRYTLDGSSLDRFALIMVDYDREIEMAMANGDKTIVDFAEAFREAVNTAGINCLCTYRAIKRLAKFGQYMGRADAIRIGLTKGLSSDDIRIIDNRIKLNGNAWKEALHALAND